MFSNLSALPENSKGRLYDEINDHRSLYERDRDRIYHSTAFRKLKDKTQVFMFEKGDYYRNRLTHTLEVSQIARSISRKLSLNEDLTECIALSHDLGHSPFGHVGEEIITQELDANFNHNYQSFRQITLLEKRYINFDGLNSVFTFGEALCFFRVNPVSTSKLLSLNVCLSDKYCKYPFSFNI